MEARDLDYRGWEKLDLDFRAFFLPDLEVWEQRLPAYVLPKGARCEPLLHDQGLWQAAAAQKL